MMIDRRRILAAGLALGGVALLPNAALAAADPTPQAVFHDPGAPLLGNPNGNVNLVEYFDYQCPFCKKFYPEMIDFVRKDGNIRFIMKDWPIFGEESVYAAKLTLAAGTHRPKALDALMRAPGRLSHRRTEEILAKAGFDIPALKRSYARNKAGIDGLLERNNAQADGFALSGTPAFVAGRVLFPGVPRMEDLKAALAQSRA
ncbi:DsbA family protein [Jiella flava]|uniref:DsbA family protein n=1 Tax=Jiella flava TaxID=2816857 RepID=A0A939FZJ4_9HYPH|nr:DsbA family protein [Jiella flava]MBO0663100.1 DsbA family protein [Jiella flava]